MYRCDFCGVRFDRPAVQRRRERIDADGNREETVTEVCPICGEEFFEEEEAEDDDAEDLHRRHEPEGLA